MMTQIIKPLNAALCNFFYITKQNESFGFGLGEIIRSYILPTL